MSNLYTLPVEASCAPSHYPRETGATHGERRMFVMLDSTRFFNTFTSQAKGFPFQSPTETHRVSRD